MFDTHEIAFDKTKDLSTFSLSSLISSCLCCTMLTFIGIQFPLKSPPILLAICICFMSSLLSTVMVGTDLGHKYTRDT